MRAESMTQPNNIRLLLCDQLSAQALRVYGNTCGSTPNIDTIFDVGARFETAFTNCPLCQPARAAFWTGQYPHQAGVLSNEPLEKITPVAEDVPTLGSLFKEAGYHTAHFGKTHDAGGLRGFDCAPQGRTPIEDASPAWPVDADTELDRYTRGQVVDFLNGYAEDKPY